MKEGKPMNSVTISGNLTRDPETRTTAAGKVLATFSVAVPGREKDKNGEWQDRAEFVDCAAFGFQAERLAKDAAKGTEVVVVGKLRYSSWEKNGEKRSRLEVIADEVKAIPRNKPKPEPEPVAAYYEEEIPF